MKNIIKLVLFMFVFSSCATLVTWFRPKGFTYLYEGDYTGIDTLIYVDGYYYSDSTYDMVFFYRDGSAATMTIKDKEKFFDSKVKSKYLIDWGAYRLIGDTIRSQSIIYHGGAQPMNAGFDTYIIKSKTEIELYSVDKPYYNAEKPATVGIPLYYHPYCNKLDSAHWLKDHRWFWKDKKAYKEYKKNK